MVPRVVPNSEWISRLSPIYYYNLSKPLIPGVGTNLGGMAVELALAAILGAAAIWLFVRRDVGGTVPLPRWLRLPERPASRVLPVGDWSLGSVYARSMGMIAMPTFCWTLGTAAFAAFMVYAVQLLETNMSTLLSGSPAFSTLIKNIVGGNARVNARLFGAVLFFLPRFLMALAGTHFNGSSSP